MNDSAKRLRILKIWEILYGETDEDHPISTEEIRDRLDKLGIKCDRRTLYDDIDLLQKNGYEIMIDRRRSNWYYVEDRKFETSEVIMLIDTVQSAVSITEEKTKKLVDKISSLYGARRGEMMRNNIVEFKTVKSQNEHIYYSIDCITRAIINGKKITYNYFDYDENFEKVFRKDRKNPEKDKLYKINPVATIYSDDKYYLIGYHDNRDHLTHYRVDRMISVKETREKIKESPLFNATVIEKYKLQVFDMFGGELQEVSIVFDRKLLDAIYDRFGKSVKITPYGDGRLAFSKELQVSPRFLAWCCSFGEKLQVVSPQSVIDEIKTFLHKTMSLYE